MEEICELSIVLTVPPSDSPPDAVASIEVRCEALHLTSASALLHNLLTQEERRDLSWYLEEYWKWPYEQFLERGKRVETLLHDLGKRLFVATFGSPDARSVLQAWWRQPAVQLLMDNSNDRRWKIIFTAQKKVDSTRVKEGADTLIRHSVEYSPSYDGKNEQGRGYASAFRSPEVVQGLVGRQAMPNAEDASGVCCSGEDGMEVGKEQQAQARRKPAAIYRSDSGQSFSVSTNWRGRIILSSVDNIGREQFATPVNTKRVLI